MALKRILGSAVRHPVATTGMVLGVAKGSVGVVRRVVRGESPFPTTSEQEPTEQEQAPEPTESTTSTATVREPEVVLLEPEDRDLPEPVVIHAVDEEPGPAADPDEHVEVEEELVWTSESEARPE
jgi:hypothetical protein